MSIRAKLFTAILAAVLVVVLVIASAVTFNMRAGFTTYLLKAELARLDVFADRLERRPGAQHQWPEFSDADVWNNLVEKVDQPVSPSNASDRPRSWPGKSEGRAPPPPRPHLHSRHTNLNDRLVLMTMAGQVIAGPTDRSGDWVERLLVAQDNEPIGRLRLYEPRRAGVPVGQLFGPDQLYTFLFIIALAVLLSALIAWLLARQLSQPVVALENSMSQLASGDFSARLHSQKADELGRLARAHDALAEALEQGRNRERQWITDASHELQTPLALLRAEIEALQDGVREPNAETLGRLHASVMRLSTLVSDLNRSLSDKRTDVEYVSLDLMQVVDEAIADTRMRARKQGIELQLVSRGAVLVCGDAGRLRQVVDNLLENACRYTSSPGEIRITCTQEAEGACLIVEDTAPAPSAEALPYLFDRFFRGEASRARESGGSGLGLAICRSLIEAHGGKIDAGLSELGGLIVTVYLPLA